MGWSGVVCSVLWLCAIYSCVLAQSVYFFSHFESAFMLTKLPLLSQWVTFWPPQDSSHVHVANTRHGGSGPGVWACVNTRHRWVAPWACCCSLPSAASSGCPDSNLIRLTVTRILISSNSVPLCWIPLCLSLTFSLTVTRSLSRLLLQQRIQYTGLSGTWGLMPSLGKNACSFFALQPYVKQNSEGLMPYIRKMGD